jgi:hypothetical protein
MSMSATTVPILPIEKGALVKLWGGVALAVVLAGGLAWWGTSQFSGGDCGDKAFLEAGGDVSEAKTSASGLTFQTVKAGKGTGPADSDVVLVNFSATLAPDGKALKSEKQAPMAVQGNLPGLTEALKMMQPGGSYRVCIPGKLAYGVAGTPDGNIPPNATINFELDLIAHMPAAQYQQMMAQEQARQQQGGQAPGGAPGPR